MAKSQKSFLTTDGKLVLELTEAENGWLAVRAPFERGLFTQAKTVSEAFANAYDALELLKQPNRFRLSRVCRQ